MQTFISPEAREQKQLMKYTSAINSLERHLYEGGNQDSLARQNLRQQALKAEKAEREELLLHDYYCDKASGSQYQHDWNKNENVAGEGKQLPPSFDHHTVGGADALSSIGDVSGSVRFSTNDKNHYHEAADEDCVSSSSSAELERPGGRQLLLKEVEDQ